MDVNLFCKIWLSSLPLPSTTHCLLVCLQDLECKRYIYISYTHIDLFSLVSIPMMVGYIPNCWWLAHNIHITFHYIPVLGLRYPLCRCLPCNNSLLDVYTHICMCTYIQYAHITHIHSIPYIHTYVRTYIHSVRVHVHS